MFYLKILYAFLIVLLFIAMLFASLGIVFSARRALKELKPGIKPWSIYSLYNPLNLLFSSKNFNGKGKEHRRSCITSVLTFLALILVMYLLFGDYSMKPDFLIYD